MLGVLATSRYLLPAVAGLPFMRDYWAERTPRGRGDVMRAPVLRSATAGQLGLIALTSVTAGLFLLRAFASHFAIQDDARQFLAWMARLRDPGAMPGDLTADYFHSVSPPLFRLIYALPAAIGVEPVMTSRLLVPLLLIASAFAAWRVATAITPRPAVAFLTAACAMLAIVHDDGIFSATPRAFFAPLFLTFLDGMLRERRGQMVIALTLLAAIYPAPALRSSTDHAWPVPHPLARRLGGHSSRAAPLPLHRRSRPSRS